jgi:hypothetical protein
MGCCVRSPCRGINKEENWDDPVEREVEKRWRYSSVVGYSPESNDVSTEAEESLLRAVARERFLKAQAGKRPSACCGGL